MNTPATMKDATRSLVVDPSVNRTAKRLHDPTFSNRAFAIFFIVTILIAIIFLLAPKAGAQTSYTWSTSTTGTAWLNATNWTGNANHYPGVDNNASSTADGASNDIAAFGSAAFSGTVVGINMNTSASTGVSSNSGANGSLTLTGVTLNGTANTILANESAQNVTITNGSNGNLDLALGNSTNNVIQINGAGGITINSVIKDGSGNKLTLNAPGSGTLTLTGANTYTGATTINAGTLTLNFGSDQDNIINNTTNSSALVLAGGTLNMQAGRNSDQRFNGVTINAGSSSITTSGANNDNKGSLSLNAITRNTGGTVNFTVGADVPISTTTANALFTGGQQTILGGYATVGGNTWAVSGTGGTAGAITGLATYNSGFAAGKDVDATTGTSSPSSMTINSLRFNSAGAYTVNLGGALTIATGGILETSTVGNNAVSINSSSITSGNGQDLIIIQNNTTGANSTMTINSMIVDNGGTGIGLTKSGGGTLLVAGANTYTGGTTINAGTLRMSGPGTLGSISGTLTAKGGFLDLNGTDQSVGALNGNAGTIYNSAPSGGGAPKTLTIGNGNATGSFGGTITDHDPGGSGFVKLVKTGSGTETMTSTTSNYTGGTDINGGTLLSNSSNGGVLGRGPIVVNNSGTLGGSLTIDAAASITVNSGGTLKPGRPALTAALQS